MRMRFPTSHTRHLCAITIFRKDPEENPYKSKYIAREMLELAVPGNWEIIKENIFWGDQTIISMAIFRHLPYYKHELGGDFKYFTIWSLGWIQVEIVLDETAVDRVWVICWWTIFRAFLRWRIWKNWLQRSVVEIVMPSLWQEKSWQGRGKGEVFFCFCSILSRPFFWRKISDLNPTLWDFGSAKGQFSLPELQTWICFSEAVVDDECMDFFRRWFWMDV